MTNLFNNSLIRFMCSWQCFSTVETKLSFPSSPENADDSIISTLALTQALRNSPKTTGNESAGGRYMSRSSFSILPLYEKRPSAEENNWLTNGWLKQLEDIIDVESVAVSQTVIVVIENQFSK